MIQDKIAERHYYEQLFRTRGRFDQFQISIYEQVAAQARAATDGTVALDLGCGSGTQSQCLMERGFSVVSADLSFQATKIARLTTQGAGRMFGVLNADAEFLPFRDASVDACICSLLLHHFATLEPIAAELRRVVRPGGVVIATDANAHNPFVWLFFNVVHRLHPLSWMTTNQRALWRGEIERTFSRYGFGEFRFSSFSTALRRDWLGDSLGYTLNFHVRNLLMQLSRIILPPLARGNGLLSVFRRLPDAG
jgi:SAM-dependent methyltransferase